MLSAGTSAQDADLAGTDFILEAHEYVIVLGTTEFSFDDALLSHSDTTGEDDAYTGVVTAAWTGGETELTAGETVAFRLEGRDRLEQPQFSARQVQPDPHNYHQRPYELWAQVVPGRGVQLGWSPPTELAGSVTGYQVLRAKFTAGPGNLTAWAPPR